MNFKRLLKPILVILAILILTLSVSAGDLFSTYEQRIKVTVDHTKIDADLSWFPVTVFLGNYGDIDVGTEAIDRSYSSSANYTYINKDNPANASGKITSVEIFAETSITGAIVATFYQPDPTGYPNNLTARDSYEIGSITAGSKQTFVVDLDIEEGDYLGIYYSSGTISSGEGIFSAAWRINGDYTDCNNEEFTYLSQVIISLYATGFEKSQGAEVFTEFDADEDFDRIAFTSSDGETQLYADCELFDDSEQKAIYHVSKTGWTVSSSSDTKIYIYYDKTAGHNTTYISKSGGIAAQSVWDGSFEAVYHMADNPDSIDVGSPAINRGYNAGIGKTYIVKENPANASGVITQVQLYFYTSATNVKVFTCSADGNYITSRDVEIIGSVGTGLQKFNVSLNIEAGDYIGYYAETGNLRLAGSGEGYAGIWELGGDNTDCNNVEFSSLSGRTLSLYGMTVDIIDSTSNANHGDKKDSAEPTEATGKVGQGQDFDGSDDYIDVSADTSINIANDVTLSVLFKLDNNRTSATAGLENLLNKYGNYAFEFPSSDGALQYAYYDGYIGSWQRYKSDKVSWDAKTYFLANLVHDTTANKDYFYVDGSLDVERADSSTTTNTTYELNIGHHNKTNFIEGLIDEIRISSTNRSAAWIAATYDSLWDTLLTYGAEETGGSEPESSSNILFIFSNF